MGFGDSINDLLDLFKIPVLKSRRRRSIESGNIGVILFGSWRVFYFVRIGYVIKSITG